MDSSISVYADAKDGDDANVGTEKAPLRTLRRVSELCRTRPAEINLRGTFGREGPDTLTLNAEAWVGAWDVGQRWGHVCVGSEYPAISATRVRAGRNFLVIQDLKATNPFRDAIERQTELPLVSFACVECIGVDHVSMSKCDIAGHQLGVHVAGVGDMLTSIFDADNLRVTKSRGVEKSSGLYATRVRAGYLHECRFISNGGGRDGSRHDVMNHGVYVNMEHQEQLPWVVTACRFYDNRSHGAQFRSGVVLGACRFRRNSCALLSCLKSRIYNCKFDVPAGLHHAIDLNQGIHEIKRCRISSDHTQRVTQSNDPWYDPYWPADKETHISIDGLVTHRIVKVKARVPVPEPTQD